jgi:hypothetical protein
VDADGGCLCGFWLESVIDRTWALHGPRPPEPDLGVPAAYSLRVRRSHSRLNGDLSPKLAGVAL